MTELAQETKDFHADVAAHVARLTRGELSDKEITHLLSNAWLGEHTPKLGNFAAQSFVLVETGMKLLEREGKVVQGDLVRVLVAYLGRMGDFSTVTPKDRVTILYNLLMVAEWCKDVSIIDAIEPLVSAEDRIWPEQTATLEALVFTIRARMKMS